MVSVLAKPQAGQVSLGNALRDLSTKADWDFTLQPSRGVFDLVATTLGGHAWDAAGPIWYAALRDDALKPAATFKDFAAITLKQARQTYGSTSAEAQAVEQGWKSVKVL